MKAIERGAVAIRHSVNESKYAGCLNKRDAKAFEHWWTVRGHQVRLCTTDKKGIFAVYLRLNPTTKPERQP